MERRRASRRAKWAVKRPAFLLSARRLGEGRKVGEKRKEMCRASRGVPGAAPHARRAHRHMGRGAAMAGRLPRRRDPSVRGDRQVAVDPWRRWHGTRARACRAVDRGRVAPAASARRPPRLVAAVGEDGQPDKKHRGRVRQGHNVERRSEECVGLTRSRCTD